MFAPNRRAVKDRTIRRFAAATEWRCRRGSTLNQRAATRDRQPRTMPSMLNTASAIQIST
jgi:hypothetical protein